MPVVDGIERAAEDRERNQKREPGCLEKARSSSSGVDARPRTALRCGKAPEPADDLAMLSRPRQLRVDARLGSERA